MHAFMVLNLLAIPLALMVHPGFGSVTHDANLIDERITPRWINYETGTRGGIPRW